jgi:hypothetical protein
MRNGFRIVDIDTHVNPSYETLVKYLDPGARSRVAELQPFVRTREGGARVLHVAPYPFDRFPGEAPQEGAVVVTEEMTLPRGFAGGVWGRLMSEAARGVAGFGPAAIDDRGGGAAARA